MTPFDHLWVLVDRAQRTHRAADALCALLEALRLRVVTSPPWCRVVTGHDTSRWTIDLTPRGKFAACQCGSTLVIGGRRVSA